MIGSGYETRAPFFRRSSFSLAAPCAARYLRPRRLSNGIYARKSFRRGRQARVMLVSKSSGPCGSAVVRLGVLFALVGIWAGGIVRIRVWISRQGARCVRLCPYFCSFCPRAAMDLRGSARISKFGKRHHCVFRHSPASDLGRIWIIGHKTNAKDVLYSSGKQNKRRTGQWMSCRRFCVLCQY